MSIDEHLTGKSDHSKQLFFHLIEEFRSIGEVSVHPAKTMIGIATPRKRIAYVTQFGKNFLHLVFMFETAHHDNLCFQKIVQVPGEARQYNHHLRMFSKEDINDEVKEFMRLAYLNGS